MLGGGGSGSYGAAPKGFPKTLWALSSAEMGDLVSERERGRELPRGTVTFLFTDIAGSTALLRALGRERYGELLAAQRELLARVVEEHGGVVVDMQGDALFAAFAGAGSAVAAAAAAQLALAASPWTSDPPLRVRIGLHSGEATPTGDAYVGISVHRGKRVSDAAHGGQVVLSAATHELVHDELPPGLSLRDLGRAALAGFEGAERLSQLVVEGLPDEFPPVRAKAAAGRRDLLERASELAALEEAIDAAAAGVGHIVAIEGAAGIGKSSLLAEARERASGAGLAVLMARGSELERSFPFGIVRQLFEPPLARMASEERSAATAGAAALAAPLFGLAPAAEEDAFAILHGLYWLTANLADRRPLLVAIDDLHWADAASMRWVDYLARRLDGLPVLALATLRPPEDDPDPALADLLADPATVTIRPAPLSRAATTTIVGERLGGIDEEALAAVSETTRGNPLLLHELVSALARGSSEEGGTLAEEVRRIAPEVVSRRVRLELAKLGSDAAALARAVAVLGEDEVSSVCVPKLAGLDAERTNRAVLQLARAEIIHRDRPFRFVHPLLRRAVYDALSSGERETAHERAAALLAETGAEQLERVAAQLLLAPARGRADVVEQLRAAARRALAEGAPESAVEYLGRALAEPPPDPARPIVLLELAAAHARLGGPGAVEYVREALPLLPDPSERAEAGLMLARGLFWRSKEEEAVVEIERALAEAADLEPAQRRALEAEYYANALRVPHLHETARQTLDSVDVGDADDVGARMLLALQGYSLTARSEERERAVRLAERALARGIPPEEAPSWSFWGAVSTLLLADRFEAALGVVDETLADARRRGAVYLFSGASMVRATVLQARGALSEAEADARASVEALPARNVMIAPLNFGLLAQVLVERGLLEEAAAMLRDAGADGALPESFGLVPLLRARAVLRLAQGDARAALADALSWGRAFEALGFLNPAGGHWRSQAALAQLALGEPGEASQLAEQELTLARRWGASSAVGRALRVLAVSTRGKATVALLRESVLELESSPALLERARSLIELGSALRRDGKQIEARDRLRAGLDVARRCGAAPLAEHAEEELIAAGARPRARALSGAESLTPSEKRIAAMAAGGASNREIAQSLFVTQRTVEMHLSNAFRKLDIKSRTQLGAALAG
jgi:class 3 adenylate cyclase/DNA-binding CsgD family transcriptional regulator